MNELEIKKLLASDQEASLTAIYDYVGNELYCYMAGMTGSSHDSEELLNELFIKISDKRYKICKAGNIKSYLYRMAGNLARDRIKRNRRHMKAMYDYSEFLKVYSDINEIDKEKIRLAVNLLDILPAKQREVVVMKIFMQKTFVGIGDALGISENTAASRYHYALKKLKKAMEQSHE